MVNQKSREFFYFKIPVFVADFVIHVAFFIIYTSCLSPEVLNGLNESVMRMGGGVLLFISFSIGVSIFKLRLHERRIKVAMIIWRAIAQTLTTYLFFLILLALVYRIVPRLLIGLMIVSAIPSIVICHYSANRCVRLLRRIGHNTRHVVIIGADETAKRLYQELVYGQVITGFRIAGFFSSLPNVSLPDGAKLIGTIEDSYKWLSDHFVDEIYCSLPPDTCSKEVNALIQICNEKFIDFSFVPTMDGYPHRKMEFHDIGKVTIIQLRPEPLNSPGVRFVKRLVDIVTSSLFLCTIYPLVFLFVWLGDIITGSKGPVYFCQARTGYNGKSFKIYKFRSMKVNAEADTLQATENDPRKTKFGDFLRRSSIDELPQFINVLKGEMSIVGPRPHMEHHTEIYSKLINDYMVRHLAKPGITGWAQVNGCRGETKTLEEMKDRVEHDIWYIEHWTPLIDIEIIVRTIWQILPGHDKQAY